MHLATNGSPMLDQPVSPSIRSVNLGQPTVAEWTTSLPTTGIIKQPVGQAWATRLGIEGDHISDLVNHGGPDQAVYAYAREDLDWWGAQLGKEIPDGFFGENLTTQGIDVNGALIGERWQVGDALLEVASIRIPCRTFSGWLGLSGYDNATWVKRFTNEARPGPYFRVLEEGTITGGDVITVVHRPGHDVTVRDMFRALTTDRTLLPRLLAVDGLVHEARLTAERYVAGRDR